MSLDLTPYEALTTAAVRAFWQNRGLASERTAGRDTGTRGAVTGGKNHNGFVNLVQAVVAANGDGSERVYCGTGSGPVDRHTVLPGYYRPVKDWDVVVMRGASLVAAVEFKSQVGSLGNNFNNRAEEAVGMGEDLRVAFREGRFGAQARPFVGYLLLVGETAQATTPVRAVSRHFETDPVFAGASYAARYDEMCRRLVREGLYDAATLLLSPAGESGAYREWAVDTGIRPFVARLAARVAEAAAV